MAAKKKSAKSRSRKAPVLRGADEEQLRGRRATGRAVTSVSKAKALTSQGRLKKGCHFKKGGRAYCFREVADRLKETYGKDSAKKKSSGKKSSASAEHVYKVTSSLPFKKGCRYVTKGKHRGKVVCTRRMSRRRKAS